MGVREKDIVDNIIGVIDNGLRVVFAKPNGQRPSPTATSKNNTSKIQTITVIMMAAAVGLSL